MIVSLVQLASTAANPDLRRRLAVAAADAAGVPIDVRVNIDVTITVGRRVIVGLQAASTKRSCSAGSRRWLN